MNHKLEQVVADAEIMAQDVSVPTSEREFVSLAEILADVTEKRKSYSADVVRQTEDLWIKIKRIKATYGPAIAALRDLEEVLKSALETYADLQAAEQERLAIEALDLAAAGDSAAATALLITADDSIPRHPELSIKRDVVAIVDDARALPDDLVVLKPRLGEIKKKLRAGEIVIGAHGEVKSKVRVKPTKQH